MMIIVTTVSVRAFALALLLAATGCSNLAKPGPQSVAGMSPDGTVSMTEIIAVGAAGGKGTFELPRAVLSLQAGWWGYRRRWRVQRSGFSGDVHSLKDISDFAGLYTQSSGGQRVWTRPKPAIFGCATEAGVVLHLKGRKKQA